jgi:hypothetical protein
MSEGSIWLIFEPFMSIPSADHHSGLIDTPSFVDIGDQHCRITRKMFALGATVAVAGGSSLGMDASFHPVFS